MKFSRTLMTAAVAVSAGAFALGGASSADAKLKSISIGTNPPGTNYFLLGGMMAKVLQEATKIRTTTQPHAGASVYVPLLNNGEMVLGLNSSIESALGYNGRAPYKRPNKNLRALARFWVLPYGYFARANSGIKTVGDLKGKKVIIDIKSNASLATLNKTIMATAGLGDGDYTAMSAGNIPQNINAVVEGRADAAITAMGIPILRKAHSGIPGGIQVLELGPKATNEFMKAGLEGSKTLIAKPRKPWVGVDREMKIAAFDSYVNIGAGISDDDAYMMLKAIHDNWATLQKQHPIFRGLKPSQLGPSDNPHPYHPGAIKFFKEMGYWSAANDKQQMMYAK